MKKPRKKTFRSGLSGEPFTVECHGRKGDTPGVWVGDFFLSKREAILNLAEMLADAVEWMDARAKK